MGQDTKIQWAHHTFNPVRGCQRVSPGCENCYAEALSRRNPRVLGVWGPSGTRVVAAEAYWRGPVAWGRSAARAGERRRVFCASLSDVFEDWSGPLEIDNGVQLWRRDDGTWTTSDHYRDTVALDLDDVRCRLFELIAATPQLDWLLLTKRPENILTHLRRAGARLERPPRREAPAAAALLAWLSDWLAGRPPANVWLGTSVEDQPRALERIPHLLKVPARLHFLSCEPLLGPVALDAVTTGCGARALFCACSGPCGHAKVGWVIVGGESGASARPMGVAWARGLLHQCRAAEVPVFVKQLGANVVVFDPAREVPLRNVEASNSVLAPPGEPARLPLLDAKGGDPSEWPEDLRVRDLPRAEPTSPIAREFFPMTVTN